jgi:transcription elongation GreA/GreB family factor
MPLTPEQSTRTPDKKMDKTRLYHLIIDKLTSDLAMITRAALEAHANATDKENIPENKYDTLSLEASYLAQGQSKRAVEIERALSRFQKLKLQSFDEDSEISMGALVRLEDPSGARRLLFIGPDAGGLVMVEGGHSITVITPQSPVGQNLLGKVRGDSVALRFGGVSVEFEITEIR